MSTVTAEFGGKRYDRDAILDWEDTRIAAAAQKLGIVAPSTGGTANRREALLDAKLDLGPEEMLRRLAKDIRWGDRIARIQARPARYRRRSVTEMHSHRGSAAEFASWFEQATRSSDVAPMLRACPDHFVVRFGSDGQEVVETTGGSPLTTRFTIDYDDISTLVTQADPAFDHQVAGVARASDGTAIGGVRHQFRDTRDGFAARLTVEFPMTTLPTMITAHRWHLACEFSNWIEAATAA